MSAVVVGMAWARASPLQSLCCLPQAGNHECQHGKAVTSSPSPSRRRETALSPWSATSPSPSDTESSSPGAGTPAHSMAGAVLGPAEALLSSSSPASRSCIHPASHRPCQEHRAGAKDPVIGEHKASSLGAHCSPRDASGPGEQRASLLLPKPPSGITLRAAGSS